MMLNNSARASVAIGLLATLAFAPCLRMDTEIDVVDDKTIAGYRERQATFAAESQAILAKLDAENREPNAEENKSLRENTAEVERLQDLITTRAAALKQINGLSTGTGRKTTPDNSATVPAGAGARDMGSPGRHSKTFGFGHFGEFSMAVRRKASGGDADPRLSMAAAGTVATEGAGADGGYLVPPEFRDRLLAHAFSEEDLLARTDQQVTSRNSITFPKDETTPWGTSGVRVYWENEAAAITQSKPALGELQLKTSKLAALCPVTDELLEDSAGLGNFLESAVGRGMNFAVGNAIIDGTGAGQPLGILRSPALISVAAEGGQTADTVNVQNVAKMWARMPADGRKTAVWLVNPDVEAQFITMTLGGSAAAFPVYLPPNGMSASPFATMLGRPVIPHMACKAIGDVGDIMFADLKQYVTAVKTGGMKSDVSMHLWFDQGLVAYRFTVRLDGRPWMSAPISPKNGSSTLSPFISLAAR